MEDAHGSGAASNFAETAFDGIGGAHPFALIEGRIAPAGEQFVEIAAQASDGLGIGFLLAVGETAGGGAGFGQCRGVHDAVEGDGFAPRDDDIVCENPGECQAGRTASMSM